MNDSVSSYLVPGCRVPGDPGHTCSLSIQGLRAMFCPFDHQPLRPLPETSLLTPVVLLGHGRICRAALALPLGQLWVLPGVFEVTCNPPCSQPGTFLAPCSFHVLHLPPPPLQLGLVMLCTGPCTLQPSLDSSGNLSGQAHLPRLLPGGHRIQSRASSSHHLL